MAAMAEKRRYHRLMTDKNDGPLKKGFAWVAESIERYDELRAAIGAFLANFAVFESLYLTEALKAVSFDVTVIEYLAELMPVEQRVKLLLYLCRARRVPKGLTEDMKYIRKEADRLRQHRNEIAHGAAVLSSTGTDRVDFENSKSVAGVRRPLSKRPPLPPEGQLDLEALNLASLHTIQTIRGWGADAEALQLSTHQFARKLGHYMRGEPWEHLTVTKPGPLDPSKLDPGEGY
jgi:hypothetical protein